MKKTVVTFFCTVAAVLLADAGELTRVLGGVDTDFAERYAFAANRGELIATLKPESDAWRLYSVVNAQNEGRLDDAEKLLKPWNSPLSDLMRSLRARQDMLAWEKIPADRRQQDLRRALSELGLRAETHFAREVPLKPNTHPSELKDEQVSFAAFFGPKHMDHRLKPHFAFLGCVNRDDCRVQTAKFDPNRDYCPGLPGFYDSVVAYLTDPKNRFSAKSGFRSLTLAQLEALRKVFAGDPARDFGGNDDYVALVCEKLEPGPDENRDDPSVRLAACERVLAFCRTLPVSRRTAKIRAMEDVLECGLKSGDFSRKALLIEYLALVAGSQVNRPLSGMPSDLVRAYLEAYRLVGADLKAEYGAWIAPAVLDRITAETDLLAGKDPSKVNVAAIPDADYRRLRDRVDLAWSAANPTHFAAAAPVTLEIDVKNVKRLRVAVYDIDAFEALGRLSAKEVGLDVDLDGCVPTVERTLDCSKYGPMHRHRERLMLKELERPGLYVVECSGEGKSSRAIVRKGRLNVVSRAGAGGHVFTAFDEDGQVAKPSFLRIGETVYPSDERGEIAVPFADAKNAGERRVVVGSGRLAAAVTFGHGTETYDLELRGFLPREAVVAGKTATLLLRPDLMVAGASASLSILEDPRLTVTLTDLDGVTRVTTVDGFRVRDDEECVYSFTVPDRLASVEAKLTGRVRNVSLAKDEALEASVDLAFNGISRTDMIEQAFLRRGTDGYTLELRGRAGEPLASRAVRLRTWHRCFDGELAFDLQADQAGVIRLGHLADIKKIALDKPFVASWNLLEDALATLPRSVNAAEGEVIELSVHGLLSGTWPLASDLRARVSLMSRNEDARVVEDLTESVTIKDGVLRIAPLAAGDYRLQFVAEERTIDLTVTKCVQKAIAGGVIAGRVRALVDKGDPQTIRIASAAVKDGRLEATLAHAQAEARVHVIASRTVADATEANPLASLFRGNCAPVVTEIDWGVAHGGYRSERNLGDEMRYVLDRRGRPHRPGNGLEKPSLLLTPWSEKETSTTDLKPQAGDEDKISVPAGCEGSDVMYERNGGFGGCAAPTRSACYDFLPEPAVVIANLKPDAAGKVSCALPKGLGAQDVRIVAIDACGADETRLLGKTAEILQRDLTYHAGAAGATVQRSRGEVRTAGEAAKDGRAKTYSSVAELYALLRALSPEDETLGKFEFVTRWHTLDAAERTRLYGEFASHELDLFLYFKDRPFFDAVVVPHLRNKRFKQFTDRWLLGEDLSSFAEPSAFQSLTVLEKCLLARRVPAVASRVVRWLTDEVAAHPVDPVRERKLWRTVLAEKGDDRGEEAKCFAVACAGEIDDCEIELKEESASADSNAVDSLRSQMCPMLTSDGVVAKCAAAAPQRANRMTTGAGRAADVRRRANRQLYRPPQRTREWRETHHYGLAHGDRRTLVKPNAFWRDYAKAVEKGEADAFLSENVLYVADTTFVEALGALAVSALPLDGKKAERVLAYSAEKVAVTQPAAEGVTVVQRFVDPNDTHADGHTRAFVKDEFVAGRVYQMLTIVTNPSERERELDVFSSIPEGAVALGGERAESAAAKRVDPYSVEASRVAFYFPRALGTAGALNPATVAEDGALCGRAEPFVCKVVAEATKADTNSWQWISQNASDAEALAFLSRANLAATDVRKVGWRMIRSADFLEKALKLLAARGIYDGTLWRAALYGNAALQAKYAAQIFASEPDLRRQAAGRLGPAFVSPVVTIEPETDDLFEHLEYWPLVNARTHALGGRLQIANDAFRRQYRAFLDLLAFKPKLSASDRLLASVYLIAQERVDEAKAMVADVKPTDVETRLQYDYLRAYLAFSDLESEEGRAIAAKYADYPVRRWRDRFRTVIAQADEIAGKSPAFDAHTDAAKAPTLALSALAKDGVTEGVLITSRNVGSCEVRAYPADVEMSFSKKPFGTGAFDESVRFLRPAWTERVDVKGDETRLKLPVSLLRTSFLLTATDADRRTSASLAVTAGTLDVQVAKEYGELRVRDAAGKPLPAAYVKVYATDASGREVNFHKDGYTDLRGAFDYASVSTDSPFRPAKFAILVLHDKLGVKTLTVECP